MPSELKGGDRPRSASEPDVRGTPSAPLLEGFEARAQGSAVTIGPDHRGGLVLVRGRNDQVEQVINVNTPDLTPVGSRSPLQPMTPTEISIVSNVPVRVASHTSRGVVYLPSPAPSKPASQLSLVKPATPPPSPPPEPQKVKVVTANKGVQAVPEERKFAEASSQTMPPLVKPVVEGASQVEVAWAEKSCQASVEGADKSCQALVESIAKSCQTEPEPEPEPQIVLPPPLPVPVPAPAPPKKEMVEKECQVDPPPPTPPPPSPPKVEMMEKGINTESPRESPPPPSPSPSPPTIRSPPPTATPVTQIVYCHSAVIDGSDHHSPQGHTPCSAAPCQCCYLHQPYCCQTSRQHGSFCHYHYPQQLCQYDYEYECQPCCSVADSIMASNPYNIEAERAICQSNHQLCCDCCEYEVVEIEEEVEEEEEKEEDNLAMLPGYICEPVTRVQRTVRMVGCDNQDFSRRTVVCRSLEVINRDWSDSGESEDLYQYSEHHFN